MAIGDENCRCREDVDFTDLATRCSNCRFEACEMFTYTEAPDTEYFDSVEEILTMFREMSPDIHEVVIFGYRKKRIDRTLYKQLPRRILAVLLEEIHEEYGDYENDYEPCSNMKQAAQDFVDLVLDHYKVWQCEPKPLASKIFETRRG